MTGNNLPSLILGVTDSYNRPDYVDFPPSTFTSSLDVQKIKYNAKTNLTETLLSYKIYEERTIRCLEPAEIFTNVIPPPEVQK